MVAHICNPSTLEVELKSTLAYVKKSYQNEGGRYFVLAGFVFVFVLIMSWRRHSLYERRLLSLGNEWHVSSCWLRSTWNDVRSPL